MKKKTKPEYDTRVRPGWVNSVDNNPIYVFEKRIPPLGVTIPVAVVPLPFMSAKMLAKVRKHLKGIVWPEI